MAIHSVKNDRNRVVAHIRSHANQFVSLTQVRRWTHADARLVAKQLLEVVADAEVWKTVRRAEAPVGLAPPAEASQPDLRRGQVDWIPPAINSVAMAVVTSKITPR